MVHTLPDYTTKYKMVKVFASVDNNELAARLGCPSFLDRRGNFAWIDDFSACVLDWSTVDTGAGGDVSLSATAHHTGEQAVKITCGSGAGVITGIRKYLAPLPYKQIGYEITHTFPEDITSFEIDMEIYDGGKYYTPAVRLYETDDKLQISDAGVGYVDLATSFAPYNLNNTFHTLKFVIDLETGKYMRVLFDDEEYDASAYTMATRVLASREYTKFSMWYRYSGAGHPIAYIDNFIVTQNEV